jgi:polar amino acid transport system substrate-binding protein
MKRIILVALALGLVTAACASDDKPGTSASPSATASALPVVDIAQCQTAQGAQAPAAAKGVDYTTQLVKAGELSIGSDNAYPPFEEIKPGASTPEGFDVDLYTEVAKRLNLTAKSTTTDFDGLFTQSIPNGKFDLGVSAITIKEGRKKTVDFTIPYFQADLSLAVNVEKTPNIKTIDDLSGLTIGAQKGTTGEDCAKFLVTEGKAKDVRSYGDSQAAFQDLVAGRVAAIVNDRPASQGFVEKNAALAVVQVISTKEQYGFAISKDKPDLRQKIDETLTAMMQDGTYATIYEKWFGTKPPFALPLN